MDILSAKILEILKDREVKPGDLARQLGTSRQTLHRHLRVLVEAGHIRKNGEGPHVTYSTPSNGTADTRVQNDYRLCAELLLPRYLDEFGDDLTQYVRSLRKENLSATGTTNFGFLLDAAAVYSSNIEGNTLDLNSFLNSRMSPRKHRSKEAQEIEDLVSAYAYAGKHDLQEHHMLRAHKILSRQFVAKSRQGVYRREPVGVFSLQGLEYMAVEPHLVAHEMREIFRIANELSHKKQTSAERFFWAAWLHLMIAMVHPFGDGNGRTARLCEKWSLAGTLGEQGFALPSEEHYWKNRSAYYAALKLGANYWEVDMGKAFAFFALLPSTLLKTR